MSKSVKSVPIKIAWAPRWDKEDSLFYVGKSYEASVTRLDGRRIELYSTRLQLGPLRISFGAYPHEGFEEIGK